MKVSSILIDHTQNYLNLIQQKCLKLDQALSALLKGTMEVGGTWDSDTSNPLVAISLLPGFPFSPGIWNSNRLVTGPRL